MFLGRALDEKFASLYRAGKIHGGVYIGRGQEALSAAIGVTLRAGGPQGFLLGLVAEQVTGRSLATLIRGRLLDPLGLDRIVFQPDEPTPRDHAHGFLWGGGDRFYDQSGRIAVTPHESAVTVAWAAGAMAASSPDLARWAEAL